MQWTTIALRLVIILTLLTRTGQVVQVAATLSPCMVTRDTAYGGLLVDCKSLNIQTLPLPQQWIPNGTTSLLLDSNFITSLDNTSFSSLESLSIIRLLSLKGNGINTIQPFAFSGFNSLQRLDLSANRLNLDREFLRGDEFRGLSNLLDLDLSGSRLKFMEGNYSDSLFSDLTKLEILSLDTFRGELYFGSLFNTTRRLSSLSISGRLGKISNVSFQGFADIHLKGLTIRDADNLRTTETGAFQNLKYLDSFTISHCPQDIVTTLDSLAPFANRTFRALTLSRLNAKFVTVKSFTQGSLVTRYAARHLSKICVESFSLTSNTIFVIESGVFSSAIWRQCLKNIDLSDNPINGEYSLIFEMLALHHLEYFKMTGRKYVWTKDNYRVWEPPTCAAFTNHRNSGTDLRDKSEEMKENSLKRRMDTNYLPSTSFKSHLGLDNIHRQVWNGMKEFVPVINCPKSLKSFIIDCESFNMMKFDKHVSLKDCEQTRDFHAANNGISNFIVPLLGLPNLQILDLSHNDGSLMISDFLDFTPSIIHLNMGSMNLDSQFMSDFSERFFRNMPKLKTLDLSNNDLHYLASNTFTFNRQLSVLLLSGNRFQSIPFELHLLSNLCLLDLRENSLRSLSSEDIASLENHASKVRSFSLQLAGNAFSCRCDSLEFLAWLQNTRIKLDNNGNYSCTLQSGKRVSLGQIKDLQILWRSCYGQRAFWLSLVLACFMVMTFVCAALLPKFKTQLKAFFLKTILRTFAEKTPADYDIGVYVAYCDHDTELACHQIRTFIEKKLKLTTYVRHRDLLPASDIAETIMESVHSSWRVLLLVSPHFLDDPWSYFHLKAATYAVQADNPGRMVLVLLLDGDAMEDSLLSKVPACVLGAMHEENIVWMTGQGNISYENKQALTTALMNSR